MNNIKNTKLLCSLITTSKEFNYTLLKEQIVTNQIPWDQIVAVANKEYLIPVLYVSLKNRDLFDLLQDEQLKEFLQTIYKFNLQRNEAIIAQTEDLVQTLGVYNITPLLLKGIVSLAENDYLQLGMRHLTDIDIVINKEHMIDAFNILMSSGYSLTNKEDIDEPRLTRNFHHVQPISKNGMPASVELHHHILVPYASKYMQGFSKYITKCSYNTLSNVDILSPTYRVYHSFLHTEIQDKNHLFKKITLRHLYDFTILVNKYDREIDWNLLSELVKKNNCRYILEDYLYLVRMFFSLETPLTIENARTIKHYKKVLKVINFEDTIMEKFYPIVPNIKKQLRGYSYKNLKHIYSFNSYLGYILAIFKSFYSQIKKIDRYLP